MAYPALTSHYCNQTSSIPSSPSPSPFPPLFFPAHENNMYHKTEDFVILVAPLYNFIKYVPLVSPPPIHNSAFHPNSIPILDPKTNSTGTIYYYTYARNQVQIRVE